ncbi:MAG: glutamate racemase [Thermodesulfovibrionales bacterium]
MTDPTAAIGVFDSGIGGLTVLKEIFRVLPSENTIYLGDTARVPYGIRSPETVTRYSFENTRFLSARSVKVIIIACNTASSVSLEAVRSAFPVPVIGVIEPGAKAAVGATRNGRIGIIGTDATIRSGAYERAIHALDPGIEVSGTACPLFVPLVEEGWTYGEIPEKIAEQYLRGIAGRGIDTLVLGCTHYPLLKPVIEKTLGSGVSLIDSATATAAELKAVLERLSLGNPSAGTGSHEYYVTDSPEKFVSVGQRFLGMAIDTITKISLETEV